MPDPIPVIDLEPWFAGGRQQRLELCQQVGRVCHEVGFFYVVNHAVPAHVSDNTWHPVDPVPGSLVVNTGELLQLITHNYFIATPHRVINRADSERYSSAFFYSPDLNTLLDPLPIDATYIDQVMRSERHRGEGLMASRTEMTAGTGGMASSLRPTVFGERYWQRWVRSYPEIARKFYPGLMA